MSTSSCGEDAWKTSECRKEGLGHDNLVAYLPSLYRGLHSLHAAPIAHASGIYCSNEGANIRVSTKITKLVFRLLTITVLQ